jgi:hypothetical protein
MGAWTVRTAIDFWQGFSTAYRGSMKARAHQGGRDIQVTSRPAASRTGPELGPRARRATAASPTDAVSALVNLGYRRREAESAIARAADIVGEDVTTEDIIKCGLKLLARPTT